MIARLLILCLLANAAQAACPTSADMAGDGVWVVSDDGGVTHYDRQGDTVLELTVYDDGEGFWTRSHKGVLVLEDGIVFGGHIVPRNGSTYTYPVALDEIALPRRNASWEGEIQVTDVAKGETRWEQFSYRAITKAEIDIGACAYYAVRFRAVYQDAPGGGAVTELEYIPDLGISLLAAGGIPGPELDVFYSFTGILAEKP